MLHVDRVNSCKTCVTLNRSSRRPEGEALRLPWVQRRRVRGRAVGFKAWRAQSLRTGLRPMQPLSAHSPEKATKPPTLVRSLGEASTQ